MFPPSEGELLLVEGHELERWTNGYEAGEGVEVGSIGGTEVPAAVLFSDFRPLRAGNMDPLKKWANLLPGLPVLGLRLPAGESGLDFHL